jgi:predicted dehydrogenase
VFHRPLLAAEPRLSLAAVVVRNVEHRALAAEENPGATVVASLDDALPLGPDLVVIATPHASHVELASQALEHGVAVVVDKPVGVDGADARRLADVATRTGTPVTVFHNRRWDSDFRTVADLADQGRLGEIHTIESTVDRWRPLPKPGSWRERAPVADGGGILLDLGPHLVDQAVRIAGPVVAVHATLRRLRPDVMAEDDFTVRLEHASGTHSVLASNPLAATARPRFRIMGTGGAVVCVEPDDQEARLRAGADPAAPTWGHVDRTVTFVDADGDRTVLPVQPGAWPSFYAQVAAALAGTGPMPVTLADAVHVLDILDAARRSAATRSWIDLRSVEPVA